MDVNRDFSLEEIKMAMRYIKKKKKLQETEEALGESCPGTTLSFSVYLVLFVD